MNSLFQLVYLATLMLSKIILSLYSRKFSEKAYLKLMSGHQTKSPQKKKCYLLKVLSKETSQISLIFTHT